MAETFPNTAPKKSSLLLRTLKAVPILGYGLRCFAEERISELLWLVFAAFLAVVLAVVVFGWPAASIAILALTALAALIIMSATFV